MNESEFLEKEMKFIDDVKQSDLYLKIQELSHQISTDEHLVKLAMKRDQSYQDGMNEPDEVKKKEYLVAFKNYDDEFKADEKVKEYLRLYQRMKDIFRIINDELDKELRTI